MIEALAQNGFVGVPGLLDQTEVESFQKHIESELQNCGRAGLRGVAGKIPEIAALASSSKVKDIIDEVLKTDSQLVRSILFNKSPESNWQVIWHQDLTIAVREKAELEDYTVWSVKEGVPHVQPPVSVLERMITIRIHLDRADESNGALVVVPGSHTLGRIAADQAAKVAEEMGAQTCIADAGDALLMSPLILHSSRKAEVARPRRVIHLEYAGCELPEPLEWLEIIS